jgi:dinuclear metal center YbgI/SA1388 family protein
MTRTDLETFLNDILKTELFDDYCPNGLQVEGKDEIKKIVFAVSATKESIDFTASEKADALIVHHGLFWKFHGTRTITGPFSKRVIPLIKNDINLYGYHLPLDAHEEFGNAASLAKLLNLTDTAPFGLYKGVSTGIKGYFKSPIESNELIQTLTSITNHSILYSNPPELKNQKIKSIGIITGGANSEWKECIKYKLDAYLTGEMSEHDYHESREAGIHMFAAGHHATEKFGILELMKIVQSEFPTIKCIYKDSENPA